MCYAGLIRQIRANFALISGFHFPNYVHEGRHREDDWEGIFRIFQPGWKKEQRAWAAEVPILQERLSELDVKEKNGGLTDPEKKEKVELTHELQTAISLTQGPSADKNAQRYYREIQNRFGKLFTPNPDKDNKVPRPQPPPPSLEPGKRPPCLGCEKPKPPKIREDM